MTGTHNKQWALFESIFIGVLLTICAATVVFLPFLIPRDALATWPAVSESYNELGRVFPYLSRSLVFSNDPDFYIVSKLILFGVGVLCVVLLSILPLSKNVEVRGPEVIDRARRPLWWFWILFSVAGYGVFFDTYKANGNLSWASKAAVDAPIGIAVGNFVQFGVFALVAGYILLVKHYFRVRSIWESNSA